MIVNMDYLSVMIFSKEGIYCLAYTTY